MKGAATCRLFLAISLLVVNPWEFQKLTQEFDFTLSIKIDFYIDPNIIQKQTPAFDSKFLIEISLKIES